MMKKVILLLLLLNIVSSCDFFGEYYYYIENRLSQDTVTVKTYITGYRYSTEIMDSIFVILPNEKKLINVRPTGPLGKYEHPDDILAFYCELGQFEVFINGAKLNKNLWERRYWRYNTEELKGIYLLEINAILVEKK